VLAQESERPAEAGHNGAVGANPLHLGLNNTNDTNTITTMTAGVANDFAFRVDNNGTNGSGIFGESRGTGIGLRGNSARNGVLGDASAGAGSTSVGVFGVGAATGIGVRGASGANSIGSTTRIGVDGISQQVGGIGVRGEGGGNGVAGTSANGTGVSGTSTLGNGVFGTSTSGAGVAGSSSSGIGVFGSTTSGTAGLFVGPVLVQGDFTVTGAKSAAVPLPGGTLGRTYAMECPDSWLADFGEGQLTDGFRRVPIDPKAR